MSILLVGSLISVTVIFGFLVTFLTKSLFVWLHSLVRQQAGLLVVPNFFHFTIIYSTVLLGTLKVLEMILCLALICALPQSSLDTICFFLSRYAV